VDGVVERGTEHDLAWRGVPAPGVGWMRVGGRVRVWMWGGEEGGVEGVGVGVVGGGGGDGEASLGGSTTAHVDGCGGVIVVVVVMEGRVCRGS
jgi:hypothetical protein